MCQAFGVSIGFHSGSGKSAENYRLCGAITGSRLEIKTSGRYTYEILPRAYELVEICGVTARCSKSWYAFTLETSRSRARSSAGGRNKSEAWRGSFITGTRSSSSSDQSGNVAVAW